MSLYYTTDKGTDGPALSQRKNSPKVTPLSLGRLRVERRFDVHVPEHLQHEEFNTAAPEDLTVRVFGGFGLLDGTDVEELPGPENWSSSPTVKRAAYKNCRLIDEICDPGQDNKWILTQVYETLTDTWELEELDRLQVTENGLEVVIRVQVARRGITLPYSEADVGSATQSIGGKTLTLAGIEDRSTDRMGRVATRWAEAGVVSRRFSERNNGKLIVETVEAFASIPTADTADAVAVDEGASNVDGIPTRLYRFYKGEGIIRKSTRNGAAGIKYREIVYLSGPSVDESTAEAAALGDHDTALTVAESEDSGHKVWRFSTIDDSGYDGSALVESEDAQRDGAIVYARSAWNQDPAAPGTQAQGYYNTTKKTTREDGGKKTVLMTWVKVPGSYTEKNVVNFKVPGVVSFSGSRLKFEPGVTRPFVATVSHSFTNTPATAPAMYEIKQWSALDASYVDADGKLYFVSEEFPGYLGDGFLASSNEWFGETVESAAATLSSNPGSVPTGAQNIDFQANPYLFSLAGTRVYRNTTVTITLPGGS